MSSSLTAGKPKVKIKIKPNHRHSNRKLKKLIKVSNRAKFITNYHTDDDNNVLPYLFNHPESTSKLYDDDDDDDDEDEDSVSSLLNDEDYYADERLEENSNIPMDIDDPGINVDRSTIDYEEKYDVDPNKDDTLENRDRNREELDITIENTQQELVADNINNNNEHHEHPDNQDEEKHVHWELPPDHDESSEHMYSYIDTLEGQTVLTAMTLEYSCNEDEIKYAKMLCVAIDIGVENAGYALVDQGASRALIRRSKVLTLKTKYEEIPVFSHCVLSSSGARIPITSRFACRSIHTRLIFWRSYVLCSRRYSRCRYML